MSRSKFLWHRFTIEQFVIDCQRFLASKWFASERLKIDDKEVAAMVNLPDSLLERVRFVSRVAQLEFEVSQFLKSQFDREDAKEARSEIESLKSLVSKMKNLNRKHTLLIESNYLLSPLVSSFKGEAADHFNQQSALAWKDDLVGEQAQSVRVKTLKNEKTEFESSRDAKIRKCNKRQVNLYKKLKQVGQENDDLVVIDLAFATRQPFRSIFSTKNPSVTEEETPSRSTHFVNEFLALRSAKAHRKTLFKGLKGYVRKLEQLDPYHAIGGYITLMFNREEMHDTPFKTGRLLAELLAEMSPDKPREGKGLKYPTYVFTCSHNDHLKLEPPKRTKSAQQQRTLQDLIAKVNFYTHSEYFFESPKASIGVKNKKVGGSEEQKMKGFDAPPSRSFTSGFSRTTKRQ